MADNITSDPPSNVPLIQSDEFVIAHSFRGDGTLLPSTHAEAAESAWVWKSYGLADARARRNLETDGSLPEVVREALLSPGDQYQITYEEGWLYGELPDLQHKHYGDPRELGYFRFAFNDRLFISGRRHPLQSVDDVRQAILGGKVKPKSPTALFNAIFRRFLELLKTEITKLSETLDSIEDHIVGESWQGERERLVPVRRQIVVFHRYLTAATGLFRHIDHADRRALPLVAPRRNVARGRRTAAAACTPASGRTFGETNGSVEPVSLRPVRNDRGAFAEHRDQWPVRDEHRRTATGTEWTWLLARNSAGTGYFRHGLSCGQEDWRITELGS